MTPGARVRVAAGCLRGGDVGRVVRPYRLLVLVEFEPGTLTWYLEKDLVEVPS